MNAAKIGPGALVLVVGPSGAGKDTIISLAARTCRNDPTIVFARRVVTRPSTAAEDHDSVTEAGFDDALARGHFAFWWDAHGHRYGIPKAIDDDIRAGRTAVCNMSRAVVADLKSRYARTVTVLVTAPEDVLTARLRERGRESPGSVERRLSRNSGFSKFKADVTIVNDGPPQKAADLFFNVLRDAAAVGVDRHD